MFSETFYADVKLEPGSGWPMPGNREDRNTNIVEASTRSAAKSTKPSADGLPPG
jgi:hypothetical protein